MRESQAARKLPKGEPKSEAWEARRAAFGAVRQRFQFSEYALHDDAKQFGHSWLGDHLDSQVVQKVATRAFKAVLRVGVGRAGRPRFKGKNQINSLEGKSHKTGTMARGAGAVEGAGTAADLSQETRSGDRAWVGKQGKVVRIVRRKINGRNHFTVQLICEGDPDHKEKNELGAGDVGIDIGPSTIAIVALETQKAELRQFCGN